MPRSRRRLGMHADGEVVQIPSAIPAETACDCAAASCSSSCHCNQRWKSTAAECLSTNLAIASAPGCRSDRATHSSRRRTPRPTHTRGRSRPSADPSGRKRPAYASRDLPYGGPNRPASRPPAWLPMRCHGRWRRARRRVSDRSSRSRHTRPRLRRYANSGMASTEIQRADEAPRRRQIRRRLHRRGRCGRVQRIDQDITGAMQRRRHRPPGP